MSRIHGRSGVVTIGTEEISGVTSFSYDVTADSTDATAMGDPAKEYLGGLKDGSGTVEMRLVPEDFQASATGQGDLYDALSDGTGVTLTLEVGNTGETGDLTGYTGSVIVNSFAHSQSFDDVVNITFGFQGLLDPAYKS